MAEVCLVGLGGKHNHAPYPKKKRQKTKFVFYDFQPEMGRNRWIPDASSPTRKSYIHCWILNFQVCQTASKSIDVI